MSLESGTYVDDLVVTNPTSGDLRQQGDDHLRLIKTVLKNTFPNADKAFMLPIGVAKTGNYTLLAEDDNALVTVDATSGAFNLTLPTLVVADAGWSVTVVKIDSSANAVTLVGTVNGAVNPTLRSIYHSYVVKWTGSAWVALELDPAAEVISITGNRTLLISELPAFVLADTSSGSIVITPPAVAASKGRRFSVLKTSASNTVTVDGTSWTINGGLFEFVSDGTTWRAIAGVTGLTGLANTWSLKQTFLGPTVWTPVSLTSATSIAWDLSTGNDFHLTLAHNATLAAFTNGTVGQKGTLRITEDGTGGRTLNLSDAVYDFSGGLVEPISTGANEITEYDYEVISSSAMRLTRKWMSGRSSIGFWKEYDLGSADNNANISASHGLGRYPAAVQVYLECTSTNLGYSAGDRLLVGVVGQNASGDAGIVGWFSTNEVGYVCGDGFFLHGKGSFDIANAALGNWKVVARVYE